ncbi:membrane protein [Bacteroidia bacterium]|nr:membrane protein [Bacteroidia bacterium]
MKKSVFLLATLLMVGGITAQAQFKWGLKAGLNVSKISFSEEALNDLTDVSNYTGFQVGPMVEFTVPLIGIGMDAAILYSNQGFKGIDLQNINLATAQAQVKTYKTNSLLVPVNLKYKLTFLDVVGAYATAGPYAKFRLSDDLLEQYETKSFGAGLNFGIGVELLAHLQVGVNYQLGLTDDYSQSSTLDLAGQVFKGKDRVWTVSAAYLF